MDSETEALFRQTLTGDYDSEASWEAVHRLRALGTREIFNKAAEWSVSKESRKRARAADILAQLGVTMESHEHPFLIESFDILAQLLEHEKEPRPIASAIAALGHLKHLASLPLLIPFANHPDAEIRFNAAFALGSFAYEPHAIAALMNLMKDHDENVRNWATFSLGVQGDADSDDIRTALLLRLNDSYADAKLEAIIGLAKRKDERVLPVLLSALAKPEVAVGEIEAACLMLGMKEDRADWNAGDYARTLRERFGKLLSAADK